jgi:hypothetical protein
VEGYSKWRGVVRPKIPDLEVSLLISGSARSLHAYREESEQEGRDDGI